MKKLSIMFVALALALTTAACGKKDGDKNEGKKAGATDTIKVEPENKTGRTAPTPPAAEAKLAAVDLSVVGEDWAGLSIMAPEGATAKESFGAGEVKAGDHFQLEIHSGKADLAARKKESDENDINKVKRYLVESADALVMETELMGKPEFHFVGNVKAGDKEFYCENVKGPVYTQADVEAMWKACQSITKK